MCVVYSFYFYDYGCLDHRDWNYCGQNYVSANITWVRGIPDTARKYPKYAYPTPDSINRGSEKFTPINSQGTTQEGTHPNSSRSASDIDEVSRTPAEVEDAPSWE
jgi:hypothetical protein